MMYADNIKKKFLSEEMKNDMARNWVPSDIQTQFFSEMLGFAIRNHENVCVGSWKFIIYMMKNEF